MRLRIPRNGQIDSWMHLATLAAMCTTGRWIFRGERLTDEPLRPKAGRVGRQKGAARKKPYRAKDEQRALEDFKRQARPYIGHTPVFDLEWLAIAQHHGMSTRLLDWTESLLVAAYFAAKEAGTATGVIYAVQGLGVLPMKDQKNPFRMTRPGIYEPPHITPRIPAQRSIFTVHPNPTVEFRPRGLHKWIIPPRACGEIKHVLDACGVNESSLFPDLDGLSRYVGWRYKWGRV